MSRVKVFILTNNDLHYDLLLLSSTGCIAISTGYAHNQFPFPCSNGYWNAAPIVYAIGAFYLAQTKNYMLYFLSPRQCRLID
ncbi:hypothetical protein CV016_19345 [Yersinia kristensenii]|uniref:Uncharacterized protein n=1 Tax=Yersinia kristensenii TaxID=28152 RepID=A0AB73PLG1_YERKR|nr:hypothetical protein CBW52_14600 [Yersinia kristensenii]PHZ36958.1 hypothetical protein CS536_04825 [Yersinia kristensenii]PJE82231.1 hypothetical protein CU276_19190 [Yersinia kristensenii]PJG61118.1 hypothetical protein CV016_19345 [Yersinia kristensenii]